MPSAIFRPMLYGRPSEAGVSRRGVLNFASALRQALLSDVCSSASNFTYATGTSNSVRNRQSDCPPMTVMAIAARPVPPMPSPRDVGIRPAMIAQVVIRIGRSLVRQACTIASRNGMPSARRVLA